MRIGKLAATMLALSMSMAACGGGGGGSDNPQPGAGGIPPVVEPPPANGNGNGGSTDFAAAATVVPAEGTVLSERVRLEIEGTGIQNAELLPAAGGRPYALFNVEADQSRAWVEFDTRTVANGTVQFMIQAYDQPPRTAGAQTATAMQPRTWVIQNASISSPYPGDYPLRRDAAPLQEMIDLGQEEFASRIEAEWPRIHALLQEYIPDNVVFVPPVPLGFEGPRSACIQNAYASPEACREYMLRIVLLIP